MQDEALRQEVRDRLRLPVVTALGSDLTGPGLGDRTPEDVGELLAAAIAAADDPVAVLESAATDPDPVVAAAAAPYLNGELPLPAAEPRRGRRGRQAGNRGGRAEPEAAPQGTGGRGGGEVPAPTAPGPAEGQQGATAKARRRHRAGRARGGERGRSTAPGSLPPRARGTGFCFLPVRQGR